MFLYKYDYSFSTLILRYEGKDDVSKAGRVFIWQLTYDTFFNVRLYFNYKRIALAHLRYTSNDKCQKRYRIGLLIRRNFDLISI